MLGPSTHPSVRFIMHYSQYCTGSFFSFFFLVLVFCSSFQYSFHLKICVLAVVEDVISLTRQPIVSTIFWGPCL